MLKRKDFQELKEEYLATKLPEAESVRYFPEEKVVWRKIIFPDFTASFNDFEQWCIWRALYHEMHHFKEMIFNEYDKYKSLTGMKEYLGLEACFNKFEKHTSEYR